MGGTDAAFDITMAALKNGKVVVSANKAVICKRGAEIFAAARKFGGAYFFEASVAGGIPIIKVLREGLVANRFSLIYGILNGTCNYILTRMERENATLRNDYRGRPQARIRRSRRVARHRRMGRRAQNLHSGISGARGVVNPENMLVSGHSRNQA